MPHFYRFYICLIGSLLWFCAASEAADSNHLQVGATAPDWMMTDIVGRPHSLYGELEKGHSVVMVFWASWCKFCRELMPELNLFQLSLPQNTTTLFAMNIWEDGDPVGYFDSHDIKLPLILKADAIARRYNVQGTPGVVLVGEDRKIRYMRDGNETINQTIRSLQKLLLDRYMPKDAAPIQEPGPTQEPALSQKTEPSK